MNTYMVANGVAIHSASDMPRSGAEYAGAPLENINTTKDVEQEHEPSTKKGGFVAPSTHGKRTTRVTCVLHGTFKKTWILPLHALTTHVMDV